MPDPQTPVLFFGNDWFAENRTSSHHIARWLARRYRVVYVECPGLRPKSSGRDLKKIWTKLARSLRGARPTLDGVRVKTLFQIPFHRFGIVRRLNRMLMVRSLRKLIRRERLNRPITWFMVPHLAQVVGRLGERLSVYYCIDDYAALPDVNERVVRGMDEETTRRAGLVFVASDTLLDAKRKLNPDTHVSPHGVDLEHFARAQSSDLTVPLDVAGLPTPVVGFFGLIERWIDLDLVDYLAQQRPKWTFVLVGRVAIPEDQMPRRPNIHYIGKRHYEELPSYGKKFDVAIIPYRLTRQVLHANPIKLREYLAMGKPVVAVSTPEIDKYSDVVDVAQNSADFLARLDSVLTEPPTPGAIEGRMRRVAAEGWDARLRRVEDVLNSRLACVTP